MPDERGGLGESPGMPPDDPGSPLSPGASEKGPDGNGRGDAVRRAVEEQFRIYDERTERLDGDLAAHLYYVMFPHEEFDRRFEAVRAAIRAIDDELLVFMRRDGGEDILFVAPRPGVRPASSRTHLVLLVLTLLTTATAGAIYWEGYANAGGGFRWSAFWDPVNLAWGALTFALPLMAILGVHETAHYVVARRHGLRATLPYFIPVPPMIFPIGTLGAFIRLQDPLPDRKALFDVGASGPLAGFALAVPLLLLGGFLTGEAAVEVPDLDRPDIDAMQFAVDDSERGITTLTLDPAPSGTYTFRILSTASDWKFTATAVVELENGTVREDTASGTLGEGQATLRTVTVPDGAQRAEVRIEWDDHLIEFGDPLLIIALEPILKQEGHLTHPTFFAAWVGIFVTGLNLLPAGQLDGGHVARAVLGERVRWVALAVLAVLVFLSMQFLAWMVIALFLILTGLYHPPPLNDRTRLDTRRRVLAVLVLVVFAITFIPVPVTV